MMPFFYKYEGEKSTRVEYAINVLKRRLSKINIDVVAAESEKTDIPCLEILCNNIEGDGQGFFLKWFPDVDTNIIYDPSFTYTSDVMPELIQLSEEPAGIKNTGSIAADSPAGILYGVIEFCERCETRKCLPIRPLEIKRGPKMLLRSSCLLLMKAGRYDLNIEEKEFPWFYDKKWWTEYLDFFAENRYNAVTLWNFHPFPYFSKLPHYAGLNPVDGVQLEINRRQLMWICQEAEKRNMKVIFHFYNIYVSHEFADSISMKSIHKFSDTQKPLVYAYITECIKEFVNSFPNVGLMPCLGEGIPGGEAERYAAEVLIPAINETGKRPLFIVRQWATLTAKNVSKYIIGTYDNLYVMFKHNAEHIAGEVPDSRIKEWIRLGIPCMVNMHMISEVGPFRWSPYGYIKLMCLNYQAMGLNGIHVYPHWSWRTPGVGDLNHTGDEIGRDRLYHECWGRYSFDAVRDDDEEKRFWANRMACFYKNKETAAAVIESQDVIGRTLTRIQQHLWIHYDNHSIISAGFTIKQYFDARSMHGRKIIMTDILEDILPLAIELRQGTAPVEGDYSIEDCLKQSLKDVDNAIRILDGAGIASDATEAGRCRSDAEAIKMVIEYHRAKIDAVKSLNEFCKNHNIPCLKHGVDMLSASLDIYRRLTEYTSKTYAGISDVNPVYPKQIDSRYMPYHWSDLLDVFEQENKDIGKIYKTALDGNIPAAVNELEKMWKENAV